MVTRPSSRRIGAVLVLVVSIVLPVSTFAHGGDATRIHACVNSSGRVRIVSPGGLCNPKETATDWNITGAPGPQGPQGAQGSAGPPGPSSSEGLAIYDSTVRKLGDVITVIPNGGSDGPIRDFVFPFRMNGTTYVLTIGPGLDIFFGNAVGTFFESTDCSGPMWISPRKLTPPGTPAALPHVAVLYPGWTMYIGNRAAEPEMRMIRSALGFTVPPDGGCYPVPPSLFSVIPAEPLIDLLTIFTPPFSVR